MSDVLGMKSLIIEGSFCVYFSEKIDSESFYFDDFLDQIDSPEELIGNRLVTHLYIRLGYSNTWVYCEHNSATNNILSLISLLNPAHDDEDYEEEEDDDTPYDDLKRLGMIVAMSKGFNLLKNRDQRTEFGKKSLKSMSEEYESYYLSQIITFAESFYDYGVLPLAAKALKTTAKQKKKSPKLLLIRNLE